ncbi:MAG: methionine-rich copper-binding protein CopC [Pseudohongiellaceae bacterium]|jgi:methionine-rich copper-binding protein CopC
MELSMTLLKLIFRNLALMTVLLASTSLFAHNTVTKTTPAEGEVLMHSPEALVLNFSDDTYLVTMELKTEENLEVPLNVVRSVESSRHFSVPVPQLSAGKYTVNWLVEGDDTHQISGSYTFSVTGAAQAH